MCVWWPPCDVAQESLPILSVQDYMITGGMVTLVAQLETVTLGYLLLQMFS